MDLTFNLGGITIVISVVVVAASIYYFGKLCKKFLILIVKNINQRTFLTETKLDDLIRYAEDDSAGINQFVLFQLITPAAESPFHIRVIIDNLIQLRKKGLSISKIHSLIQIQFIVLQKDFENTIQNTRKLSNFRIERYNKVEQTLKPELEFPNATVNDAMEDSKNYDELIARFIKISKFDLPISEIFEYIKFNYKVSKYLKKNDKLQ